MYKIRISNTAKAEIQEIYYYIADVLNNKPAALRRIDLIDAGIKKLSENPGHYPLVRNDYLASKGIRCIVVKTHIIFFIINEEEKSVYVLHILYGRRDWVRLLKLETENNEFIDLRKDDD